MRYDTVGKYLILQISREGENARVGEDYHFQMIKKWLYCVSFKLLNSFGNKHIIVSLNSFPLLVTSPCHLLFMMGHSEKKSQHL